MKKLHKGPSTDAPYKISIHWANLTGEDFLMYQPNKHEWDMVAMFAWSGQNEEIL